MVTDQHSISTFNWFHIDPFLIAGKSEISCRRLQMLSNGVNAETISIRFYFTGLPRSSLYCFYSTETKKVALMESIKKCFINFMCWAKNTFCPDPIKYVSIMQMRQKFGFVYERISAIFVCHTRKKMSAESLIGSKKRYVASFFSRRIDDDYIFTRQTCVEILNSKLVFQRFKLDNIVCAVGRAAIQVQSPCIQILWQH